MNDVTVQRRGPAGAVALTWGAAAVFSLLVMAETKIGPVVVRVTPTHGMHLGDVVAILLSTTVALFVTAWLLGRT